MRSWLHRWRRSRDSLAGVHSPELRFCLARRSRLRSRPCGSTSSGALNDARHRDRCRRGHYDDRAWVRGPASRRRAHPALGPTLLTAYPGQSFTGGVASGARASLTLDDDTSVGEPFTAGDDADAATRCRSRRDWARGALGISGLAHRNTSISVDAFPFSASVCSSACGQRARRRGSTRSTPCIMSEASSPQTHGRLTWEGYCCPRARVWSKGCIT